MLINIYLISRWGEPAEHKEMKPDLSGIWWWIISGDTGHSQSRLGGCCGTVQAPVAPRTVCVALRPPLRCPDDHKAMHEISSTLGHC